MSTDHDNPSIPLVVQLGFAGSRNLFDSAVDPESANPGHLEEQVCQSLIAIISGLGSELKLSSQHFFCGISQIAIGSDTAFTRACQHLKIPQRIFLPQHLDEYLNATGRQSPDFSPPQKQAARDLVASPHIIQQRVVSDSAERYLRFSDTNSEIVRVSDVLLCLVGEDQSAQSGGTLELIEIAKKRGKPILLVTVHLHNGTPVLTPQWLNLHLFQLPVLPRQLHGMPSIQPDSDQPNPLGIHNLPTAQGFAEHLKMHSSRMAKAHKGLFKTAALIIISTHILATVCAVIAVQFREMHGLFWFLVPELVLLALGFTIHRRLHRREASQLWAMSRLIAELGRSQVAVGQQYLYLEYLFQLPFPASLRPLLRTLSVLHLASTAGASVTEWEVNRDRYIQQRLAGNNGQIEFYARESARSFKLLRKAHAALNVFSLGAFAAAFCKLTHIFGHHFSSILGPLAILLPVLAVAVLSLAAAFDLEARKHTFNDMLVFLRSQHKLLNEASTAREFGRLVLETESRLLGETVNWYSRRSFTGIT